MYYNQLETGRRIQKLRRERYLTQEELAIKLNISDRHLRNLERGESANLVFPACAFLMEKHGVRELELLKICGSQNFAADAVLRTASSTGAN